MATNKNGGGLLALLLLGFLFLKPKKGANIIIEPAQPAPSKDADFLIEVKPGGKFYSLDKTKILGIASNVNYLDGFSTHELPSWVKVRLNGKYFFVYSNDFKIL